MARPRDRIWPVGPRGLVGRVSRSGSQESLGRGAGFRCLRGPSGLLDRLTAELCRHHVLQLELLLGRQRKQLVRGLLSLKRAFGALAARNDVGEHLRVGLDVLHDLRLRSEEHTSELQSLMRISYAFFCLKKKKAK